MKYFDWDDANNAKLRAVRGIGFEEIVFHIERGDLLDILDHQNSDRYRGQRIFIVRREDYVLGVLSQSFFPQYAKGIPVASSLRLST